MKSVTRYTRISAAVVAATMLAACAGGTNSNFGAPNGVTPNLRTVMPVVMPAAQAAHKAKRGKAKISIRIPLKKKHGHRMHPEYISPSTKSMRVVVAGGAVPAQTFNLTPAAAGCTTNAGILTCTETAFFPPGQQAITITLYDQTNGTGNQLSSASEQITIAAGTVTNVSITLNGVPSTAAVLLNGSATTSVPQGVATSIPATVTAKDADGNIIMSPGDYSPSITLTDSDTSGTTTLSTTSVAAPGTTITLAYTGGSLSAATITPNINGTAQPAGAATLSISVATPAPTVTEFPLPAGGSPTSITVGSDGALWFTELYGNNIGRIATDGSISEYSLTTSRAYPAGITTGPDGALWFAECEPFSIGQIGRIATDGTLTEFTLPPGASGGANRPLQVAAGSDGALWFTENYSNSIGRITTDGAMTFFAIPTSNAGAAGITAGPDHALWFTEEFGNNIGRITTTGTITEYPVPTSNQDPPGVRGNPMSITVGPDGALWFAEEFGNKIGRITTAGAITEYSIPTTNSVVRGVTTGPDGALWFAEGAGKIGRVTTAGGFSEYATTQFVTTGPQGGHSSPDSIVAAPAGAQALWFTDYGTSAIGLLTLNVGNSSHRSLIHVQRKHQ